MKYCWVLQSRKKHGEKWNNLCHLKTKSCWNRSLTTMIRLICNYKNKKCKTQSLCFINFCSKCSCVLHTTLRRYDTIKTCPWNFLNFPELFIIGKYVKIKFKNWASPCYLRYSMDQYIKNITKIKQKSLFLFTFLPSFFMAFLVQKLIYTINIWFNFVLGSFFKQNHLLNLIILGGYAKR